MWYIAIIIIAVLCAAVAFAVGHVLGQVKGFGNAYRLLEANYSQLSHIASVLSAIHLTLECIKSQRKEVE